VSFSSVFGFVASKNWFSSALSYSISWNVASTYLFYAGKMKIKSTLLNNCGRQLLNSQVSGFSWRCWIHRFQTALLDETIGCSQHQLLFNICFAGTIYSKLHPFYKSKIQLLLIFSNSHHCICRWFFRILITAGSLSTDLLEWIRRQTHVLSLECPDTLDVQILNSTSRFEALWNLLASNWPGKYKNSSWLISNACKYLWPCACSYVWYVVDSVHSCQSK